MTFMEKLHKGLKPYMKEKGLRRKGRYYYKMIGDMVLGIGFDNTGRDVHAYFFLMPLYIRSDVIYITYGERLNVLFRREIPMLGKTAADEEISAWVNAVAGILDSYVMPFFRRVDSPEKLLDFLTEGVKERGKYLFCTPLDIARLRMYTLLYLRRTQEARESIEVYRAELGRCGYLTDRIMKSRHEEANCLESMLDWPGGARDAYFGEAVEFTKETCFG